MKCIIKYPKINNNLICDGKLHEIEPLLIHSFNFMNTQLFLLEYYDLTIGKDNRNNTIIIQKEDSFYNVPLLDYGSFLELIFDGTIILENANLKKLFKNIEYIDCNEPILNIFECVSNDNFKKK